MTASAQRHLLDGLPDNRQPDQFSCGASAAFSVGEFFGVGPKDIGGWKEALGTDLKYSTHPHAIYNYLRSPEQPELPIPDEYPQHDFSEPCGLRVECKHGMTIEDLRQATRVGCPVIVPVQDYGHRREKGAAFQYGHYLIVVRVSMGRVTCQDSTTDNLIEGQESIQEPGRIPIRAEDFLKAWHDQDAEGNQFVRFGIVVGPPIGRTKAWRESEHPRGQPENAGQFGPGGAATAEAPRKPDSGKLRQSQASATAAHPGSEGESISASDRDFHASGVAGKYGEEGPLPVQARDLLKKSSQWAKQNYGDVAAKMSDHEAEAVQGYVAMDYRMNEGLRAGKEPGAKAKALDAAIDRFRLKENVRSYRGLSDAGMLANLKAGDTFQDKGFSSTSIVRGYAERNFAKGALVAIDIPKGSKALPVDAVFHEPQNEGEVILPRGSKFRVKKIAKVGDTHYVHIELLA